MYIVGSENVDRIHLGIGQSNLVILDDIFDNGEILFQLCSLFGQDITAILDTDVIHLRERGQMCISCNSSAADHGDYFFIHTHFPPFGW